MKRWLMVAATAGLLPCASVSHAQSEVAPSTVQFAARIDELLDARLHEAGVQPAEAAGDAEFLRRAWLDLTGVIPRPAEVRAFLRDDRPEKRAVLIEELLARPTHARRLADIWRRMLLPGDADVQAAGGVVGFQNWLQEQFAANNRYDNVVADLLVARGSPRQNGPALFYAALELKPEEIAANTSRILLGVQIQCAQCHNHPFDRWTQRDFWGYAAFFARLQRRDGRAESQLQVLDAATGEVRFPGSGEVVAPKYLDSAEANQQEDASRRRQLAIWLVSRENPFFAKASVNRVWAILFGRGLVEPVDDFSERNPPSHPQLLDELAARFVAGGYDLSDLFRTLALTRAYQRSSQSNDPTGSELPELFARMAIKSLTPEQLYDSLEEATRRRESHAAALRAGGTSRLVDPARMEFMARFQAPTQSATEFQTGIPQALTLMNGQAVASATDLEQSGLLGALDAPFLDDAGRIEALFLATLSRPPTTAEQEAFRQYVTGRSDDQERRRATADVLWALLNSAEFVLNH